jgi:hypothetical protein
MKKARLSLLTDFIEFLRLQCSDASPQTNWAADTAEVEILAHTVPMPGKNSDRRVALRSIVGFYYFMSILEQIEEQVKRLPVAEQQALRDWLDDILEDELEFTDEFKAKIEQAKRDIAAGRGRVVKP